MKPNSLRLERGLFIPENAVKPVVSRLHRAVLVGCCVSGLSVMAAVASAPVAYDDLITVKADTQLTLDYLLLNDKDADGNTLSITAVTNPANGTLTALGGNSYRYTPNAGFAGRDSFTYTVADGTGGTDTALVSISVNAAYDVTAARDTILAGVNQLADVTGNRVAYAWGATAASISNYRGQDESNPMITAATMGGGRVVVMADVSWQNMNTLGGQFNTSTCYQNSISWVANTTSKSIPILSMTSEVTAWLTAKGYTNVTTTNATGLAAALPGKAVLIPGRFDPALSAANITAVKNFIQAGGGLFCCEGTYMANATATILREAGISFDAGSEEDFAPPFTINRANRLVTTDVIVAILKNPSGYTSSEKVSAARVALHVINKLPVNDSERARLLDAAKGNFAEILPTPQAPVTDEFQRMILEMECALINTQSVAQVTAHRAAIPVSAAAQRVSNVTFGLATPPVGHEEKTIYTPFYAAPGELVTLQFPAALTGKNLDVRVSHLRSANGADSYPVMPSQMINFDVTAAQVQVANPHGGLIQIIVPDNVTWSGTQNITVSGAVMAPYFKLGETTDAQWMAGIRDRATPFGVLDSAEATLVVDADKWLRTLPDPTAVMTEWNYFCGKVREFYVYNPGRQLPVHHDYFPAGGVATYPQSYHLTDELTNSLNLKATAYSLALHEYGHICDSGNIQFDEFGETSPNMGGKWLQETERKYSWKQELTVGRINNYLASLSDDLWHNHSHHAVDWKGTPFDILSSEFGPALIQQSVAAMTVMPSISTSQGKIDEWARQLSNRSGYNMCGFLASWQINASASVQTQLSSLPNWMPVERVPESLTVVQGTPASFVDPSTNDFSYDGTLTLTNVTQPASGSVANNGNGTYTYTPPADFTGSTSFTYTVTNATGNTFTTTIPVKVVAPANDPKLVAFDGVANGNGWTTVQLEKNYNSMVVVAQSMVGAGVPPLATRIRNASGSSFEVKLDRLDGSSSPVGVTSVRFLVVEEGVYNEATHGIKMEAVKFTSSETDKAGAFTGTTRDFAYTGYDHYFIPAVFGQVMTSNDSRWSAFWFRSKANSVQLGKHVGEDSTTQRTDETIGYIVMESGSYQFDNCQIQVGTSNADAYQGITTLNESGGVVNYQGFPRLDSAQVCANLTVPWGASDPGMDGFVAMQKVMGGSSVSACFAEDSFGDMEAATGAWSFSYLLAHRSDGALIAKSDQVTGVVGNPTVIDVLGNDGVTGASSIQVTQPANGSVVVQPDGTLIYTSNQGFMGSDSFSYTVTTSQGSSTAVVVIQVILPVTVDSDNDGFNDAFEVFAGSNPNSSSSTPLGLYAGLASWWPLDEVAGNTAWEIAGQHHGTISGATLAPGVDGNARQFDGVDDGVLVGTSAAVTGTTNFTLGAWVKVNPGATTSGMIIQQRDGTANGYNGEYMFSVNTNGTLNFTIYNGGEQFNFNTTATVNNGQWHYVAAVRSGTNGYIYIDGVQVASASGAIKSLAALGVAIGYDYRDNNKRFKGLIDDVRIYTRALSASEIDTLAANRTPVFASNPLVKPNATEDAAYTGHTLAGSASDVDYGDPLTFTKVDGPEWLVVAPNGALSGTPGNGDVGTNAFTVRVTDGGGLIAIATLNVTVANQNDAPVFTSSPINDSAIEDSAFSGQLVATDVDAADNLTFTLDDGPAWLSVSANGALSGTPGNGDVGTNTFTVSVTDGGGLTDAATLTINVTNVNDAPTFGSLANANATEDQAFTASVAAAASDVDAGDTLNFSKVSGPAWLNVASNGAISGTPLNGDVGANDFVIRVTDAAGATADSALLIAVANVNDAPTFTANPITGSGATEGGSYAGTLAGSANDMDAGDTLAFSKLSGPAWLNVASNGALSGTPSSSDVGSNSFTIRVADVAGTSADATLNIVVVGSYFNGVWANAAGGAWSTSGNWSGGVIASGDGKTADFSGLNLTADATVTLDGTRTLGGMTFGDTTPSHNWILSGSSLTLDVATGVPVIAVNNRTATLNTVLAGGKGLAKTGAGNLTLAAANSYGGGTIITPSGDATAITAANAAAFGNEGVLLNGVNTFSPGLSVNTGLTIPNALTLKPTANRAVLGLSGTANWSGAITVDGSSSSNLAVILAGSSSAASPSTISGSIGRTGANANILALRSSGNHGNITGSILYGTGIVQLLDTTNWQFSNASNTWGTLDIANAGAYAYVGATNTLSPSGVVSSTVGGTLRLSDLTATNSYSQVIAGLNGNVKVAVTTGSATLTLNTPSIQTSSGVISGAVSLVKSGTAMQTLAGTNTYTGTTTVSEGALNVTGSLANGAVTVQSGGTLSGSGTIGGATTVQNGGALAPGSNAIGTLTVNNSLTLAGTTQMQIGKNGATLTADKVSGVSTMTYGGTLEVIHTGSGVLAAGDTFSLFSAATYVGSFSAFNLPNLGAGLQWDISKLAIDGTITVGSLPVAVADAATIAEDGQASISVLGNDSDADGDTLEIQSVTQGAHGTVAIVGNQVTYTPAPNWSGSDSFSYIATDNQDGNSSATVNVTVNAANDAPSFGTLVNGNATEDQVFTASVASAAADIDAGDTLTFSKLSGPAWLNVAANGEISGMPLNGNVGTHDFVIRVTDAAGATADSALSITVANVNDAPTFTADPISGSGATEDVAYSGSIASYGSDVDAGDTKTFTKVSGPAWLSVASNGTLSGTPSNSDVGPNSFTVRITDGSSATADAVLNIAVANANDAPVFTTNSISAANATATLAYAGQSIAGSATDEDAGDSLTYSKVSGPAWLNVAGSGALSGTPAVSDAGANSFMVKVTDAGGLTATATLNITVNAGLPSGWSKQDIGAVGIAGNATESGGIYSVSGSGAGLVNSNDQFHFAWQTLSGDGEIKVRLASMNGGSATSALAGVMIRESSATGSRFVFCGRRADGTLRYIRRASTGGNLSDTTLASSNAPVWLRLVRSGNTFSAYKSTDGISWSVIGSNNVNMASQISIGLAVTSASNTSSTSAAFDNVIIVP